MVVARSKSRLATGVPPHDDDDDDAAGADAIDDIVAAATDPATRALAKAGREKDKEEKIKKKEVERERRRALKELDKAGGFTALSVEEYDKLSSKERLEYEIRREKYGEKSLKKKSSHHVTKRKEYDPTEDERKKKEEEEKRKKHDAHLLKSDADAAAYHSDSDSSVDEEDAVSRLMALRNSLKEEELLERRLAEERAEAARELAFRPTADAIDSLILDVTLAITYPQHINADLNNRSLCIAPAAASGLSNLCRGSRSAKAGDVNARERACVVDMGGVTPLAAALSDRCGDYLRTCAADALANLAIDARSRVAVGESRAIERLVGILLDAAHPDAKPETRRSDIAEYAAACLRNLALDEGNACKMAEFGAVPALVQLSLEGTPVTKGMCACCLACMAKDRGRCEQICDYGAARPLIAMLHMPEEVCQLSASGCLNELSRLKRNKINIAHNGGFEALLVVLAKHGDELLKMMQEKCVCILLNLVEEVSLQQKAVKTGVVVTAIDFLTRGTEVGRIAAVKILCQLTSYLTKAERESTARPVVRLIRDSSWPVQSCGAWATLKLYRDDAEKLHFAKKFKGLAALVDMLALRDPRVHENTLSAILSLLENVEVPDLMLELKPVPRLVRLIPAINMTVRKLTFGILKCLSIYDLQAVLGTVPLHHHFYIEHPPAELDSYLEMFIQKRKQKGYLSRVGKLAKKFTDAELTEYEALFAELDEDCSGGIDATEIGLLVQALGGKKMDEDALKELVTEVDKDGSGVIEWDEFLEVMWNIKTGKAKGFGDIMKNALAQGFKRSAAGKAFTKASNYYNRKAIEMQEILNAELKAQREAEDRKRTAEKYWEQEKIKRERLRQEKKLMAKMGSS